MASEPFAIVQMEVLQDRRLTFTDTRVLIALLASFDPKRKHEPVFPRLSSLARRAGCSEKAASRATSRLAEFGWLEKVSGSGHRATRYYLLTPEIVSRLDDPQDGVPTHEDAESPPVPIGLPTAVQAEPPPVSTQSPHGCGVPIEQTKEQTREQTREQSARAKRWTVCPEVEVLTDERLEFGLEQGLPAEAVRREWDRFRDHEFRSPKQSVDRTWRNWTRRAAESALPAVRRPSSPPRRRSADEQQADVFAEIRRELGMRSEEGLGH